MRRAVLLRSRAGLNRTVFPPRLDVECRSTLRANPPASGALAWVALAVWLLGTAGAFWFFEVRDWRPFSPQAVRLFEIGGTRQIDMWFRAHVGVGAGDSSRPKLTFVHLYNPDCRCNGITERHLQRLIERYQAHGVRFVTALTPSYANRAVSAPLGLRVVVSSDRSLAAAGINTAPAALIFDAGGRLIYYGPYSDSAWCGSAGGLVEPVIDRALAGGAPIGASPVVRGCFCTW
jgi:hypothetical protein